MLEIIPNEIAKKHGLNLSGNRNDVYHEGRMSKVIWYLGEGTFTFYSNGDWSIELDNGKSEEGHTNPPTQKIWVKRLERIYAPEYATAAWFEWKELKSHRR